MVALDKREAFRHAQRAMHEARPSEAIRRLWPVLDHAHLTDEELSAHVRMLGQAFSAAGRSRAAATVHLFLGEIDAAWRLSQDAPTDLARCAIKAARPREAAAHYERAGWLGHGAIQLENAGDDRSARVLWERLAEDPRLRENLYVQALVRFNLGQACARLEDPTAARRAVVQSMQLLEAAADGFETRGLRERAFDCYQVLLTMGKGGAFENLAEGYLGCIRILREDNLKYYVLQYYEDFQALAVQGGELHAAATLFREAADFSRRHNMPYERHYRRRAAEMHAAAAEKTLDDGGSVQLVENAFAAAVDVFNELGAYSKVRDIFGKLAELPLGEKRQQRYAGLVRRLAGVRDEGGESVEFPDYLRMQTAYPEIWRLDVIEWEQAGDAAETMAEVLQDDKWPEFTRRRALLARLQQLGTGEAVLSPRTLTALAGELGRVEIYASLAPLEHLAERPEPQVRAAVLRAVRQLFFKRSFVLVMKGLADPSAEVQREALAAVAALHFGHAFDPLARIYREASDLAVRRASLESIGKIQSVDAVELLIGVLRHADRPERAIAEQLLARAEHPEVTVLLGRARSDETGPARKAIDDILRARGHI